MIPIGDYNPTNSRPLVTYLFIIINVVVFLWQLTLSDLELARTYYQQAVVPAALTQNPFSQEAFLDSIRSMFMHGGWLHLGSNMLYLWVFGDNIEDRLGKPLYIIFYLATGFAAIWAQVVINPNSEVPMIGASGAIAGVLGAYLVLHPNAKIRTIFFMFFIFWRDVRAIWVLGAWFGLQLLNGVSSLSATDTASGGVAFFAHIGGFVAGMGLMFIHKLIAGAPERPYEQPVTPMGSSMGYPPNVFDMDQSPSQQVMPPIDMRPADRAALRMVNFMTLDNRRVGSLVSLRTPHQQYYGTVTAYTRQNVTLKESNGNVVTIPLENILHID